MGRVKCKSTRPEMTVRRLVHAMGYRYRLHRCDLPGRPDLVFDKRKKVIFVHGCFWHRHPDPTCKLARLPKSRLDFWVPKLTRNRERDVLTQEELQRGGWDVCVVWECQLRNQDAIKNQLREFLGA
jgi:DNA mismatch endonuclease, patch repair protein